MATQEAKRKLATILSGDVKGYSRLLAKDEDGTVRTLNAHKEVMANLIQQQGDMDMKVIQVIFYVCILFVIMSCAHKPIDIQFCENQKCSVLTEADSNEALFIKLTDMIKANLNKKVPLLVSSEKGGKADKDIFVPFTWTTAGCSYNFSTRIHSLTFTDILSINRENREIKVMAQLDFSYPAFSTFFFGSYPADSSTIQMPCSITVKSSKEIIFQGKSKMVLFPLYFDGLIDHIDTDRVFWGCPFTITLTIGQFFTVKEGYLHLAF